MIQPLKINIYIIFSSIFNSFDIKFQFSNMSFRF